MNYFEHFNNKRIRGLDLKIDENVEKICDLSNRSSNQTRWTFYALMLICVISAVAVINTFMYANWTKERISRNKDKYVTITPPKLTPGNTAHYNQILDRKRIAEIELEKRIDNSAKFIELIQLPFIGNSFDVNNLSLIAGLATILVLLLTRFSASREKKNLRLAMHAITERYPDPENYVDPIALRLDVLPEKIILAHQGDIMQINVDKLSVKNFNIMRRQYHYNCLCMNEIFNTPGNDLLDDYGDEESSNGVKPFKVGYFSRFVRKYLLYTPLIVYFTIFANDFISIIEGWSTAEFHTILNLVISYFLMIHITTLCVSCNNLKLLMQSYYDNFKTDFKFSRDFAINEHTLNWIKIAQPLEVIYRFLKKLKGDSYVIIVRYFRAR